jgi:hypothetical protein
VLRVGPAVLPERASFRISLTSYGAPPGERSVYALAHEHRATLAVLRYDQSGRVADGAAPPIEGSGRAARVADWSAFDARFGPLFDGSAFQETSRPGVPLDHFYLPFCENWPAPIDGGYRWSGVRWEDHWRVAGPIEQGFSGAWQETFVAVLADFVAHIREKGWETSFQAFMNDKYFWKQWAPERRGPGDGTSFWLLDEPLHADDFAALAFFGGLVRRARGGRAAPVLFRADVSRPQWGRDLLDRVLDLEVSGGDPGVLRFAEEGRDRFRRTLWTYGQSPPPSASALEIPAAALDLYGRGIDGFVPWLAVGDEESWQKPKSTAILYPGRPAGFDGALPSLRLKAYRRAEEDIELVRLLALRRGLLEGDPARRAVGALLRAALPKTSGATALDGEGAVVPSFAGVRAEALEALRRAMRRELAR